MIFITFEGTDGADRPLIVDSVAMNLFKRGYSVQSTHYQIRKYRTDNIAELTPDQGESLFFEDINTQERDFDEIPDRTIVLQDRWAEAAYVYHGLVAAATYGEMRDRIFKRARQATAPDLTVYLSVSPQRAAQRIAARDGIWIDTDYLAKLVAAYDRIYCAGMGIWDQRVYRPSGHATFDEIVENVADLIIDTWKEKYGSQ